MQDPNQLNLNIPNIEVVAPEPDSTTPTDITSFKNKDNFWNLMFVLGMLVGSMTIGMIFALVIMAFVLKRFNGVSVKENKIFNSEGKEIDIKQIPNVGWVIACTIGAFILTGLFMDANFKHIARRDLYPIMLLVLFIIPALFFILKNCPIAILFNLKIWSMSYPDRMDASYTKHDFSTPSSAYFTDPKFSHLPSNVYHRNNLK